MKEIPFFALSVLSLMCHALKSVSHHQTNKKYRQLHPHGNFKGPNCFNMLWLEVFGMRSKCRGTCRLTILKVCKRITFGRTPSWKFGGVVIYCFSYAEIVESCLQTYLEQLCFSLPLHLFMIFALQLNYLVKIKLQFFSCFLSFFSQERVPLLYFLQCIQ